MGAYRYPRRWWGATLAAARMVEGLADSELATKYCESGDAKNSDDYARGKRTVSRCARSRVLSDDERSRSLVSTAGLEERIETIALTNFSAWRAVRLRSKPATVPPAP
jgi:hypothetical protein